LLWCRSGMSGKQNDSSYEVEVVHKFYSLHRPKCIIVLLEFPFIYIPNELNQAFEIGFLIIVH
jgi:hypothetical protein